MKTLNSNEYCQASELFYNEWVPAISSSFKNSVSLCSIFKSFLNMYILSRVIQAHKRDVRCIDYYQGILVTGGLDKILNLYSYHSGNSTLIASSDICESQIISIKINRQEKNAHCFVLVGCRNGKIFAFDQLGNPVFELVHNSTISSIDFINKQHFVTGSWDGKAIVWSLQTQKQISEYTEHKYAVSVHYNPTNDFVVSGSQDKALNLWNWHNGNKIKRIENAHNDIIRQIADVDGTGMIITCSNDELLKLWSAELELIQTFSGHSAFVFSVKSLKLGHYVSGGEDKTLKVWGQNSCIQEVQLPSSVWSIAFDQNFDLFVGCSDGVLRTFTTNQDRAADKDVEQIFNQQILKSSSKKSGMSEQEIKKLQTTTQMKGIKGKKEGQIKVFRSGMVPQAYMWQAGQWVKIGDVITEAGPTGQKKQPKYYPGDDYFEAGNYDHVFDVDDDSGFPKLIPYNDGGNPLQTAEKYCKRQGINKTYVEQIRKFLIQHSSKIPRTTGDKQEQNQLNLGELKTTPSTSIIEYNDIKNPPALINKIKEFSEKAQTKKLTEKEQAYIERIVIQLQKSDTYHSWTLDFKEMDALKKILTWPKHLKFPVWDILRAFLKHYQSESLFSGLEGGRDIISQLSIGLELENSQAIYALILKTLSNILIQNANKNAMLKHASIVFQSLKAASQKEIKSGSYLSAFASLLFNFSVTFIEKNVENEEILDEFADILKTRLNLDKDTDNRTLLLQAGANILSKYHKSVGQRYKFLLSNLQNDDVSSDIKMFY